MTKILEINCPSESTDYFPLSAWLYDVPFEITGVADPVYGVAIPHTDKYWCEMNEFLTEATPLTTITIDKYLPEWVEKGREFVKANAEPSEYEHAITHGTYDDELLAATYIHSELLKLTGAICIYSTIW